MKKSLALILSLLLIVGLLAACGNQAAPAPAQSNDAPAQSNDAPAQSNDAPAQNPAAPTVTIKLAHAMMESTPQHQGALEFKRLVEEKTNGQVEIVIYPAGQMGTDPEVAEMLQTDAIDAAIIPTAKLSGFYAPLQVIDLPFLFPSKDVTYAVLDSQEFKDMLFKPMEALGFHGINFWESGFKQITANKPIHTPDDLKGVKMRVMESALLIAQYKAFGANPVTIDFSETYNSLQQGAADAEENPLNSIVNMKFYEVQSDMTISNHGYLAYALMFSNGCWNSLPADIQTAIVEAANEAVVFERQKNADMESGYVQTIRDSGTEVYELNADEMEAFAAVCRPVHEEFRDVIGSDVLDATYALIDAAK